MSKISSSQGRSVLTLHLPSLRKLISYRRDILPGASLTLLVEFGPVMVSSAFRRIMYVFNTLRNLAGGQILLNRWTVTEENGFIEASLWGTKTGTSLVAGEIPSVPLMSQVMKAALA